MIPCLYLTENQFTLSNAQNNFLKIWGPCIEHINWELIVLYCTLWPQMVDISVIVWTDMHICTFEWAGSLAERSSEWPPCKLRLGALWGYNLVNTLPVFGNLVSKSRHFLHVYLLLEEIDITGKYIHICFKSLVPNSLIKLNRVPQKWVQKPGHTLAFSISGSLIWTIGFWGRFSVRCLK